MARWTRRATAVLLLGLIPAATDLPAIAARSPSSARCVMLGRPRAVACGSRSPETLPDGGGAQGSRMRRLDRVDSGDEQSTPSARRPGRRAARVAAGRLDGRPGRRRTSARRRRARPCAPPRPRGRRDHPLPHRIPLRLVTQRQERLRSRDHVLELDRADSFAQPTCRRAREPVCGSVSADCCSRRCRFGRGSSTGRTWRPGGVPPPSRSSAAEAGRRIGCETGCESSSGGPSWGHDDDNPSTPWSARPRPGHPAGHAGAGQGAA